MNDIKDQIKRMLNDGEPIERERLKQLQEKYPYFSLPTSLLLEKDSTLSPLERSQLMSSLSLQSTSDDEIARAVDPDSRDRGNFYPSDSDEKVISTEDAISTFLNNYGNNDPNEEAVLTQMIFNPTPDYEQLLAQEEKKNTPSDDEIGQDDSQDSRINRFISRSRAQGGHFPTVNDETTTVDTTPVSAPVVTDDSLLMESLAKTYVKRHNFSKALEIITRLSLNFPEKSIYFADQIRFLRKVVLIKEAKNNKSIQK